MLLAIIVKKVSAKFMLERYVICIVYYIKSVELQYQSGTA